MRDAGSSPSPLIPQNPKVIFAAHTDGIYRSDDGWGNFEPIASPLCGKAIWSVAFGPSAAGHDLCRVASGGGFFARCDVVRDVGTAQPRMFRPRVAPMCASPCD